MKTEGRFTLWSDRIRDAACRAVMAAPDNARVAIDPPKRTLDQNAKLHAMLGDVMQQHPIEFDGYTLTLHDWKQALMRTLGHKVVWTINPFDESTICIAPSTSRMSVAECSDAVEALYASGAEWGITWSEPEIWHKGRV